MKLSNGDKSSLALIIGAAKQDLLKTQDWLANYYACNADKTKGIYCKDR